MEEISYNREKEFIRRMGVHLREEDLKKGSVNSNSKILEFNVLNAY